MSRESRTRKKTPVRGAGKERESSPFPPPLAASLLACSLARSRSLARAPSRLASFAIIGDLARRLGFSSNLKRERFVPR